MHPKELLPSFSRFSFIFWVSLVSFCMKKIYKVYCLYIICFIFVSSCMEKIFKVYCLYIIYFIFVSSCMKKIYKVYCLYIIYFIFVSSCMKKMYIDFIFSNFESKVIKGTKPLSTTRRRAKVWVTVNKLLAFHWVKRVQIRSFFWSAFSRIQTEYRDWQSKKHGPEKTWMRTLLT